MTYLVLAGQTPNSLQGQDRHSIIKVQKRIDSIRLRNTARLQGGVAFDGTWRMRGISTEARHGIRRREQSEQGQGGQRPRYIWAMRMKEESWKGCYGQISRAPGVQRRAFSLFFRQRGTTEGSGEQRHGRVS